MEIENKIKAVLNKGWPNSQFYCYSLATNQFAFRLSGQKECQGNIWPLQRLLYGHDFAAAFFGEDDYKEHLQKLILKASLFDKLNYYYSFC